MAEKKSKPKAGPLASALAWEKKSLATYQKMESDATKKHHTTEMNLFRDLKKDAEKHVRNIENTIAKVKQEEARARERARMAKEKAAREKAAREKAAREKAAKAVHM